MYKEKKWIPISNAPIHALYLTGKLNVPLQGDKTRGMFMALDHYINIRVFE